MKMSWSKYRPTHYLYVLGWFESVYRPEMPEMHLQNFKKLQSHFRVEKSGEISRNLRFSLVFVVASFLTTHHVM